MAADALGNRPADMNILVICRLNRGEEGFNGVRSIKIDIYFMLGWVSFVASSLLRYGDYISAALTLTTFQNKHHVRLALELHFPFSADPPLMEALLQDGR